MGFLLKVIFLVVLVTSGSYSKGLEKDAEILSAKGPKSDSITEDRLAEMILKAILEIKSHMHQGVPELGIPPLDPFTIPDSNFDVNDSKYKFAANAKIRNAVIRNLSNFNVTQIKTDIWNLMVNVTIEIPNFTIDGLYNLDGKALSFFPIRGDGPFMLRPKDVQCFITSEIGTQEGHLYLKKFDFKLKVQQLYSKFDGIYGGGFISDVLNKIINGFGLTLFDKLEPTFHNEIRNIIVDDLNALLKDISLDDISLSSLMF